MHEAADPYARAQLLLDRRRPREAEAELRRALGERPGDAEGHALLALALQRQERPDEALREARRAVGLDPEWGYPRFVLATLLVERGSARAAEPEAREAVRLAPNDPACWWVLAAALLARDRARDALEAAEHGLEIDPDDRDCLEARARALLALGDHEGAGETVRSALELEPEAAALHSLEGLRLLEEGRAAEAVASFREALRLDASDERARDGLLEALRARNPLYRAVLRAVLWLIRRGSRVTAAVPVAAYVVFLALWMAFYAYPEAAPYLVPAMALLVAPFALFHLANVLVRVLLLFDPVGRDALRPADRRAAWWLLAGLVILLPAAIVAVLLAGDPGLGVVAMVVFLCMAVYHTAELEPGPARRALSAYCVLLAAALAWAYPLVLSARSSIVTVAFVVGALIGARTPELAQQVFRLRTRE
ncbi:MAG TPA: tetratricopeptide repeat protein [Longimicrobium sp.]|jgi:tetratricopeptide (TPR) repeat protein